MRTLFFILTLSFSVFASASESFNGELTWGQASELENLLVGEKLVEHYQTSSPAAKQAMLDNPAWELLKSHLALAASDTGENQRLALERAQVAIADLLP